MAMLLKAMGLTAPSLYVAFGNKEKLFAEVIERYVTTHAAKVVAPLASAPTARDAIEQMLLASASAVSSKNNPAGCLASFGAINSSDHSSKPVTMLRAVRDHTEQMIKERLDRALKTRELPTWLDTARLARFYHAVMGGIQLRSLDGASRAELEAVAHDAMGVWPVSPAKRHQAR